jgi:hypothetical protein
MTFQAAYARGRKFNKYSKQGQIQKQTLIQQDKKNKKNCALIEATFASVEVLCFIG